MTGPTGNEACRQLLDIAATVLEARPFETVTLDDIRRAADDDSQPAVDLSECSMHMLGSEILTHEGNSMRDAQVRAARDSQTPLERLRLAFRYVGENLERDVCVRAGVRIAGESHHCFPERNINPFRTWQRFASNALHEADTAGEVRQGVSIEDTAWILTAAGLGTKDLLAFTGEWHRAPDLLERAAVQLTSSIRWEGGHP